MQRRYFMGGALGAALVLPSLTATLARAAASKAGSKAPFFARHKLPIGVQLYTVDPDLAKDLAGTLAAVRQAGFETVESAGFHGRSAAEFRAALDAAGLRCTSAHIPGSPQAPGQALTLSGDLDALAEVAHTIGFNQVVMPIFLFPKNVDLVGARNPLEALVAAGRAMTADEFKRQADFLNEKGQALRARGLRLAYHNHNIEFSPQPGGQNGMELLLRHTDRRYVSFEMDAGWVAAAGLDPAKLLRSYPGRFSALHVKDIKGSTTTNYALQQVPTEVGSGMINWQEILPIAVAQGIKQYYVEQEPPYPGTRLESITRSCRYLGSLVA